MTCTFQEGAINCAELPVEKQDEQIVSAILAGEPGAFAMLHARYSRRLYKTVLAITRNREDAEDALQETFLRAHLRLNTFEGRSSVYSWLTRIAMNSALMILRQRRTRPETLFDSRQDAWTDVLAFQIRDSAPDPEQICSLRQQKANVLHAIHHLDRQLQAPIRMQVTQGSSLKEISRTLNISEAAAKARLHRARRRLLTKRAFQTHRPCGQDAHVNHLAGRTIIPAF